MDMRVPAAEVRAEWIERIRTAPLDELDPADPAIFAAGAELELFKRLRAEAPLHRSAGLIEEHGAYWSATTWDDVMAIDTDAATWSSEAGITLFDQAEDFTLPMFIAMDPPKHDAQRKTVSPIVSGPSLTELAPLIRERAGKILDGLPTGETIDWVDTVSIELTAMTLANLFDIPQEDRRKLTRWSDITTGGWESGLYENEETWEDQRKMELFQCVDYFLKVWDERVKEPPKGDLISMLAHGESTKDMERLEYLGNLVLLIVGGNDTTRNSITGSVLALNQNPAEYDKLKADPTGLLPNMISETIRWQTPLPYMRRTALRDVEMHGQTIKAGDKMAMWYLSGNRDEGHFERPDDFWIERPHARNHLSFGFGIHRCVGNRLAELQLKIIWEEILKRFSHIEVVGEPGRVHSSFVRGYTHLPVVLHPV